MGLSALKPFRKLVCFILLVAATGLVMSRPHTAQACGGPLYYDLTPMYIGEYPHFLKYGYDYYGEEVPDSEFLFLYPFTLGPGNAQAMKQLWKVSYGNNFDYYYNRGSLPEPVFPSPSLHGFDAALKSHNFEAAEREARAVVNEILDMPSISADSYQRELKRALEFIEIEPLINGADPELVSKALTGSLDNTEANPLPDQITDALAVRRLDREKVDEFLKEHPGNPRTPTLRYVSMQMKFKRDIPNGWPYEVMKQVPETKWRELEGLADGWLNDYPDHPLADLVRLWKNRIYYFEGRDDLAWKNMLDVYPRHLPRVLYEMRFMVYQSGIPEDLIDTTTDPLIITALVPFSKITRERWSRLWRLSEENINEPWSANLQERLLYEAFELMKDDGTLPEGYPDAPRNPTTLWGQLRAVGLMMAGKWDAAKVQIFSIEPYQSRIMLAASYYYSQGDYVEAALVEGLGGYMSPEGNGEYVQSWPEIKSYLIRVLVDDDGLKKLQSSKDKSTREAALYTEGVRLASAGHWGEAAKLIQDTGPSQAALWREVDKLSRDTSPSGYLKLARFFRDNNGALFYGDDKDLYRTLSSRYYWITESSSGEERGSGPRNESRAIEKYLCASEMWLAVQSYVKYLETARPSAEMRQVVKEADTCYNWLVSLDNWNSDFWQIYLDGRKLNIGYGSAKVVKRLRPTHPVVVKLREAGRRAKESK